MNLREDVGRGFVRRGRLSQTSIAHRRVLVNNDLVDGNSNEETRRANRTRYEPYVGSWFRTGRESVTAAELIEPLS